MLGVTVPLLVVALVVVGLVVIARTATNEQAGPGSTTSPSEGPLAVPAVGDCFFTTVIGRSPYNGSAEDAERVPCEEEHTAETIAVGQLAESAVRPHSTSDETRQLYNECEQAAEDFLGVPWRSTYTYLVLSVPSRSAWEDGARWYRCDLTRNRDFFLRSPDRTTGSLRGNTEPITCLTWFATETTLDNIEPSECDVPHQGELAGVFRVPEGSDYSDIDGLMADFHDRCERATLDFLGANQLPDGVGYWFFYPYEEDLDQWVLCLASAIEANRAFTASLRGIGAGPIPFA